ncbi:MAG: methyltransferase [Bacteroidota bacterium]
MGDTRNQKMPPVWLVKIIQLFRGLLLRLHRKTFPGNVVLYEQFQNLWLLPSLYVAAKLNVAEHLKESPLSAQELALRTNTHARSLSRIMRALTGQGIFKVNRDNKYEINGMAKGLLDEPGSLRFMLLHHLGPVNWNLMSHLEYAVRTGEDAFADKYGKGIYEYLQDHQEESGLFDRSMSNLSDLGLAPILNAYDFSHFKTIADIGGGEGFLIANIVKENPSAIGILYDLPETVAQAPRMLERYGVRDRVSIISGNFFEEVPAGAGLYLMKNIIHNWSDSQCIDLLKNVNRAMTENARMVIIEMIVSEDNRQELAKLLDIQMLVTLTGGKERTRKEFINLLESSGFKLTRIVKTIAPICLIEAKKST